MGYHITSSCEIMANICAKIAISKETPGLIALTSKDEHHRSKILLIGTTGGVVLPPSPLKLTFYCLLLRNDQVKLTSYPKYFIVRQEE